MSISVIEKILEEQHRITLKLIADALGSSHVVLEERCEAIIAKGKRENQRCNAKTQKNSTRCKTHSKSKSVEIQEKLQHFPVQLESALEPGIVFGTQNEDGDVKLSDVDVFEQLF